MNAQRKLYKVNPDSELAQWLNQAGRQPIIIENAGVRFRVVREVDERQAANDPWANYDPEKMLRAIEISAGALDGVDTEALLKEIYEARAQDTPGRPA
ncbi:MAG: hypothetical protein LC793_12055 [Thermomicrobia bacterium]|nr:hypothetical protein [Thermomicrobia bacterium]